MFLFPASHSSHFQLVNFAYLGFIESPQYKCYYLCQKPIPEAKPSWFITALSPKPILAHCLSSWVSRPFMSIEQSWYVLQILPTNSDFYPLWSCADLLTLEVIYWKLGISDSGYKSTSILQFPHLKMKEFKCLRFFLSLLSTYDVTYILLLHHLPLSLTVSLFLLFQALIGIPQFGWVNYQQTFIKKLN